MGNSPRACGPGRVQMQGGRASLFHRKNKCHLYQMAMVSSTDVILTALRHRCSCRPPCTRQQGWTQGWATSTPRQGPARPGAQAELSSRKGPSTLSHTAPWKRGDGVGVGSCPRQAAKRTRAPAPGGLLGASQGAATSTHTKGQSSRCQDWAPGQQLLQTGV